MKLPPSLICPPLLALYRVWCHTLSFTEEGRGPVDLLWEQRKPMVFALWHDELFPLMHVRRNLDIVTVVSQSRDGEYLARVLQGLGLYTARGSSSRGGVKALLQAARMMRKQGLCGCVTVDGPRGPRHKVKEGALFLAHRANAHVVPVRLFMSKTKIFDKAWDRFQLPLPGSDVRIIFGEPYRLEDDPLETARLEWERKKLEAKLEGIA